jgi:HD-GYP domain-containing protein (c-di-GMP phosphodiesterase class II)
VSAPESSSEARALRLAARETIRQLAVLIRNAALHEPGNQVFREPTAQLTAILTRVMETEPGLALEGVDGELFANRLRVRQDIRNLPAHRSVLAQLERVGLGGLRFDAVPDGTSIQRMLGVLVRGGTDANGAEAVNRALEDAGVEGIVALEPRPPEPPPDPADRRRRAINAYQQALDLVREGMTTLDSPAELNLRRAKRSVHRLVDLSYEEGDGFSLAGLAAIKSHNEYTFNHMVNVCVLSIAFGQRLGLGRYRLAQLGLCALYHDMGKLNIPLEILAKHGPLTEAEWAEMGNHCIYGAHTLFPLVATDRLAVHRVLVALQHHRRLDGSGYPVLRLLGDPGLFARIVTIADGFDAMTTKRVYQTQFLPDQALAAMVSQAGVRYDAILVKAFVNCMGIFPVGSLVLLSTGELAVVCEPSPLPEHLHRPRVQVITDGRQRPVEAWPADLALAEHESRTIRRCLDPEEFDVNVGHFVV